MIGLFGGTFDPIHIAHLRLAEEVCEEFSLEKIIFIPSCSPPHKVGWKISDFNYRIEMVRISTSNNKNFDVSDIENSRDTVSYSVDTVIKFKKDYTDVAFLMGADQLMEIRTWKDHLKLFELCRVIVMERPGYNINSQEGILRFETRLKYIRARTGLYPISSSEIRGRVKSGKSIRYLVSDGVIEYIEKMGLYKD